MGFFYVENRMADVIELKQAEEQITEPRVIKTYPSKEWIPPEGNENVGTTVFSMAEASIKDNTESLNSLLDMLG